MVTPKIDPAPPDSVVDNRGGARRGLARGVGRYLRIRHSVITPDIARALVRRKTKTSVRATSQQRSSALSPAYSDENRRGPEASRSGNRRDEGRRDTSTACERPRAPVKVDFAVSVEGRG